jgi:4-amino-4-deoxy-L-arabinose transferase-like glycosyltransferase
MQKRRITFLFLTILFLALIVRMLGINSRPIWYDEAFSILFSSKGVDAMLYGTLAPTATGSADIHPLGYYTTLWIWMMVFGESLVAARALSILAGIACVCLIYLIAWQATGSTETALVSMTFAALAPFQVHYAQEIRMYGFLTMWLLLATYAYQRGAREGSWKWWVLFALSAAIAQYSHNLAAFYLLTLALLPLLQRNWPVVRAMAGAGLIALLLYVPWLIQLPAQLSTVHSAYWVERPDLSAWLTLLLVYVPHTPLPPSLVPVTLGSVLLVVVLGLVQTTKQLRQAGGGEGVWLFYLSFGPPLLLFVFSQWIPVYIERALLPSGAIFCIWLAWVITKTRLTIPSRILVLALLAGCAVIGIYQHLTYSGFPYGPFQELNRSLRERLEPQDVIVHANKRTMLPAMLFDGQLPHVFIADAPGSAADTLAPATQEVLHIQEKDSIRATTSGAERVWYIIHQNKMEEQSVRADLAYLNASYTLVSEELWHEVQVFLFSKAP